MKLSNSFAIRATENDVSASAQNRWKFEYFSYFYRIVWLPLELLPPFFRSFVFRWIFAEFGKGSFIDYGCYIRYPWKVKIGSNVTINRGCRFFPSIQYQDVYIEIQDDVIIGPGVTFFGAGHDPDSLTLEDCAESICVEQGAYVAGNATLRYGVTIGARSVVAAGAVVVKDVPSGTIVGGNPAIYIRDRK